VRRDLDVAALGLVLDEAAERPLIAVARDALKERRVRLELVELADRPEGALEEHVPVVLAIAPEQRAPVLVAHQLDPRPRRAGEIPLDGVLVRAQRIGHTRILSCACATLNLVS
jgi:hypothetical protein